MVYEACEESIEQWRATRAEAAKQVWQQRAIAQIETAMEDVKQRLEALEVLVDEEQKKSPVHNPNDVAFPSFARALINRRDNLRSTLVSLSRRLEQARRTLPSGPGAAPASRGGMSG